MVVCSLFPFIIMTCRNVILEGRSVFSRFAVIWSSKICRYVKNRWAQRQTQVIYQNNPIYSMLNKILAGTCFDFCHVPASYQFCDCQIMCYVLQIDKHRYYHYFNRFSNLVYCLIPNVSITSYVEFFFIKYSISQKKSPSYSQSNVPCDPMLYLWNFYYSTHMMK